VKILETSRDRDALKAAAIALASSGSEASIARLADYFSSAEFLARLDNLSIPSEKTSHLQRVFAVLAEHPSDATANLCLTLLQSPSFLADDDRRIFLLPALAAVKPMSEAAVQVFRRANVEGYFASDAPLLVKNRSPRAIALFEEMIRNRAVPVYQRIDAAHASLLPYRTDPLVLDCAGRLLTSALESKVAVGVIQSVFEDESRLLFGPSRWPPPPPPWEQATEPALKRLVALAGEVTSRFQLSPQLTAAVGRTKAAAERILKQRHPREPAAKPLLCHMTVTVEARSITGETYE
jgi:hypothetical protein